MTDYGNIGKQLIGTTMLFTFLIFCIEKVLSGKNIVEGWINVPRGIMVNAVNPKTRRALPQGNQRQLLPPVYTVPGTQESPLSPRFASTGFGANITYNLPEVGKLGVEPNNPMQLSPMQFAQVVQNNQIVEDANVKDLKETFDYPPGSSSEYQELQRNLAMSGSDKSAALPIENKLPVQSMATATTSGAQVPLVMDRFIVANMKSYRYNQGDMIRGDLPIVPVMPNSDPNSCTWFRPSVNPSVDLNPGALAVLGGAFNDSMRQMVQLKMQSNSGALNTFAGTSWEPPANTSVGQALIANATVAAQKTAVSTQGAPHGDVSINTTPQQQVFTTLFP
jgi:hypothetical protein